MADSGVSIPSGVPTPGCAAGRILFTGFKHVLKCSAVFGRAFAPWYRKQLKGHGWNRQQQDDQERSEGGHGAIVPSDRGPNVPNLLHEITKGDRRVLESMSKVVDLHKRQVLVLSLP
jgi:hypothetical protein